MSSRDSLQLPRSVSRLKVGQTVLAIFVLGLTAYLEYYYEGDPYIIVPLVVAIFTLLIILYYFIALRGSSKLYSWLLLFLLEGIAVALWITSTVLAALLCRRIVHAWHEYLEHEEEEDLEDDHADEYLARKRDEEYAEYEEYDGLPWLSYVSTSSVIVGLCAIQLILYGVTLALMFTHRKRKASTSSYDSKGYSPPLYD